MKSDVLILFSRKGCCLCEALEKKLTNISLTNLKPPLVLSIVDIDDTNVPNNIKQKYTDQVPVMVLDSNKLLSRIEFPRISPRLKEDLLSSWIQKNLDIFFRST